MTQTSAQTRAELLKLLRLESRGAANRQGARIQELIGALEHAQPADLSSPEALAQLEGVWELRWSSTGSLISRWPRGWRTCSAWPHPRGGA